MKNYIASLLSDISYLYYNKISDGETEITSDGSITSIGATRRNLTSGDISFFEKYFDIVEQEDGAWSGFSATTFRFKEDVFIDGQLAYKTGDLYVAYRGTEGSKLWEPLIKDILTDSTLATFSISSGIISTLLNANPVTSIIINSLLDEIVSYVNKEILSENDLSISQKDQSISYLNKIQQDFNTSNNNIYVTGHSLGGNLASTATLGTQNISSETITFNAAGLDYIESFKAVIMKILQDKALEIGVSTTEGQCLINNMGLIENFFNSNINKIKSVYSYTGIEGTTINGILLTHVEERIPVYTQDMGALANHDVKYLKEAMLTYEIMQKINIQLDSNVPIKTSDGQFAQINAIFDSYHYEHIKGGYNGFKDTDNDSLSEEEKINKVVSDTQFTFNETLKHLGNYLNYNSSGIINAPQFLEAINNGSINLSGLVLKTSGLINKIDSPSKLYAILNSVPFFIENINSSFHNEPKYNIGNYTEEFLAERLNFYNIVMSTKEKILINRTENTPTIISQGTIQKYYTYTREVDSPDTKYVTEKGSMYNFFEIKNGTNKEIYIDQKNKLVILNNVTSEDFKDLHYSHESLSNTKVIYFTGNSNGILMDIGIYQDNAIVFDSFDKDYFHVFGQNVEINLSYGADNVYIDVGKNASIKEIKIKDNGLGDIIYFKGGENKDIINGTDYTNNITGEQGDDILHGGISNDTIYGDSSDSTNQNYIGNDKLYGGDGHDRLIGGLGNNEIYGGDGNDTIYGDFENSLEVETNFINKINGGLGSDNITGSSGSDKINNVDLNDHSYINYLDSEISTNSIDLDYDKVKDNNEDYNIYGDKINAGKGDDTIYGTKFGDIYRYQIGDGNDEIIERKEGLDTKRIYVDSLIFKGLDINSVSFSHENSKNLIIEMNSTGEKITLVNFMDLIYVEYFKFYIGSHYEASISAEEVLNRVLERTATLDIETNKGVLFGNDVMHISHTEKLKGLSNKENIIIGGLGKDLIIGGNLNDVIGDSDINSKNYSGYSSRNQNNDYGDSIKGGGGDDIIYGTQYGDTYIYNIGDGQDTIYEKLKEDTGIINFIDKIIFGEGITKNNIEFALHENDVKILLNNECIIIMNNFKNIGGIEQLCFVDNSIITKDEIFLNINIFEGTDNIDNIISTDFADKIYGKADDDVIHSLAGNDVIHAGSGNDTIYSGHGDDSINAGDGNDIIISSSGEDTINAGDGNDIINSTNGIIVDLNSYNNGGFFGDKIIGGKGDDIIFGTKNADEYTYSYNDSIQENDGNDTINDFGDSNYKDKLILNNVQLEDVKFIDEGSNLLIVLPNNQKITLTNFMNLHYIEIIQFVKDNITNEVGYNQILNIVLNKTANSIGYLNGNDEINLIHVEKLNGISDIQNNIIGGFGKDIIKGGDLNDVIGSNSITSNNYLGSSGDYNSEYGDIIEGGKGNDRIYGTRNSDTYIYNKDDGIDTISELGENPENIIDIIIIKDINHTEVQYYFDGKDAILEFDNLNKIIISDFMNNLNIEKFIFNDAILTKENILRELTTIIDNDESHIITGTNYSDIIYGNGGNDVIHSLAGNDYIYAGDGNDVIGSLFDSFNYNSSDTFDSGNGFDTIYGNGKGDVYIFNKYVGIQNIDTIVEKNQNLGEDYKDVIKFNTTISPSSISLYRNSYDLNINVDESNGLIIKDYFKYENSYNYIEEFHFTNYMGNLVIWDTNTILSKIQTDMNLNNSGNDTINGTTGVDIVYGGVGNDIINGNNGNDTLYGDSGNDTINGGLGTDYIYGGFGNDTLVGGSNSANEVDYIYGEDGDDIINRSQTYTGDIVSGGKGNDNIYLGQGNDTILYDLGDGNDIIHSSDNANNSFVDKIVFGDGITKNNIKIYRDSGNNNSVYIELLNGEKINLNSYLSSLASHNQIDLIEFKDGSIIKKEEIINMVKNFNGTINNDIIYDTIWDDTIFGLAGNDIIHLTKIDGKIDSAYGGEGNDTINGSIESDKIYGGNGNDNLSGGSANSNEIDYIYGEDGDDTINIGLIYNTINSFISGGKGNDAIYLGNGNNTILYDLGDGNDNISSYDNNKNNYIDKIVFGDGITKNNIKIYRDGEKNNSVYIELLNGEKINLNSYLLSLISHNQIDLIEFKDGSTLTKEEIINIVKSFNGTNNNDIIYDTIWDDTIHGLDGNDTIHLTKIDGKIDSAYGGEGNDTINGSTESDKIYGGNGNDKLSGGSAISNEIDYIYGEDGDDIINEGFIYNTINSVLSGGQGNDTIYLGNGNNTILYDLGDGNDNISSYDNNKNNHIDKIVFGNGITKDNIKIYRDNNNNNSNLYIELLNGDKINLNSYLSSLTSHNQIDLIEFKNGSTITKEEIISMVSNINGTDSDDIIYDTVWNDTINTGSGNDIINIKNGIDTVIIKDGNYQIIGNEFILDFSLKDMPVATDYVAHNHYQIDLGYDQLSKNISFDQRNDVKIKFNENLYSYKELSFVGNEKSNTFNFKYENDISFLNNLIIHAGDGNDKFIDSTSNSNDRYYGGNGNDNFTTEYGEDYLNGGDGDDRYIVKNNVTIVDSSGYDTFSKGYWDKEPITKFEKNGNDLIIYEFQSNEYTSIKSVSTIKDQFINSTIDEVRLSRTTWFGTSTSVLAGAENINLFTELMAQYDNTGDSAEKEIIKRNADNLWRSE